MPFDGLNFGSEKLQMKRRARDRLRTRWIQGSVSRRIRGNDDVYVCIIGSVICDEAGGIPDTRTSLMYKVLEDIEQVVLKKVRLRGFYNYNYRGEALIAKWNDHYSTTHSDVCDLMDTVVKLQEIEEFQHAE